MGSHVEQNETSICTTGIHSQLLIMEAGQAGRLWKVDKMIKINERCGTESLLKKVLVAKLLKNFAAFYGTRIFITALRSAADSPI
jgi:hypothetical protein